MPWAPLLSEAEIAERLGRVPEWRRDDTWIERMYEFPSFRDAIAFVGRLADVAEAADHHPNIDIRWKRVRLRLTTHAAKGLTFRDFDLAEQLDALAG
jgi:4a-hydroxytetrahydrobiopterin dehydratase